MFSTSTLVVGFVIISIFTNFKSEASKCEEITVPQCRDMPWTLTHMPNLVHHSSQENAGLVLSQFEPLLRHPCSSHLRFFLCSMFTPMCFKHEGEYPKIVPPCRKICQQARRGCEPLMLKFNVTWPEQLSCEILPEYHRGMCIEPGAFIERPVESEPVCSAANPVRCGKCKRFKIKDKTFAEQDYDFIIRAKVDKVVQNPCDAEIRVNVTQVFRMRSSVIAPGPRTLVFNNSCACPKLKRREYIFGGHESQSNGNLLLHPESMAEKWGRKWEKKILKWIKKRSSKERLNRRRRMNDSAAPPKGSTSRKRGKRQRTRRTPASK